MAAISTLYHHLSPAFYAIKASIMAKIPYPKHVWSPAGGWYAQPANWKANTAVMLSVIFGITAFAWTTSADREHRVKFPEPGRFYPSRYWSREVRAHEKSLKGQQ